MVLKRGTCLLPKNVKLFDGAFLLTPRARLVSPPLCAHSPAYLSFLVVYPVFNVHCKSAVFAYCSSLSVDGTLCVGKVTFLIPSAESAT